MRFKFFGIEIYISFLFVAIICLAIATDRTGLCLPTFFAVLLHESGHLIAMWICDCQPRSVKLVPASVSITRKFPLKPYKEGIIAIAGPIVNILMFFSLYINYKFSGFQSSLDGALINLLVGLFNLLPVCGLDGGTILSLMLEKFVSFQKAQSIVKIITVVSALAFLCLGITLLINGKNNISVLVLALYLLLSAFIKQ